MSLQHHRADRQRVLQEVRAIVSGNNYAGLDTDGQQHVWKIRCVCTDALPHRCPRKNILSGQAVERDAARW